MAFTCHFGTGELPDFPFFFCPLFAGCNLGSPLVVQQSSGQKLPGRSQSDCQSQVISCSLRQFSLEASQSPGIPAHDHMHPSQSTRPKHTVAIALPSFSFAPDSRQTKPRTCSIRDSRIPSTKPHPGSVVGARRLVYVATSKSNLPSGHHHIRYALTILLAIHIASLPRVLSSPNQHPFSLRSPTYASS